MMAQVETEKLWKTVLEDLGAMVSKANFATWLQNTAVNDVKDGIVLLTVPNGFTKEWIKNKYQKFIMQSLRKLDPTIRAVEYVICSQPLNIHKKDATKYKPATPIESRETPQMEFNEFYETEESLNSRYTFENFVVGSFNELAHAAAVAVTKNPGVAYNPLFVYGGVGLGKTHLLQAIGNKIKEQNPQLKAKYITSEKFTSNLVQSLQNKQVDIFKEIHRKYDLLIIDDIQFIAGKQKTQEELFHIFNTLYESGKQIVFSSDRSPKLIQD